MKLLPDAVGKIDQMFLFLILCLVSFGLVMVYSAGSAFTDQMYGGDSLRYFKVQLVAAISGLSLMLVVSFIPCQLYAKYAKQILGLSIFILLLVFTPFGHHVRSGAGIKFHRWIRLGAFGFQPVELVKLGMIIYTSNFLISKCERVKSFTQGVLPNLIILALVFFLLYVQPDFGSAVLLSLVIILLLITGGARISQIFLVAVIAGFFVFIWMQGDNYKMERIQDYVRSFSNPYDTNYQVTQSLNALAIGGIAGAGIGNSIYKLAFLPHPHNDFILAIAGEELGLLGTVTFILLFMLFVWRGIYIASHTRNQFASLISLGIITQIGLQSIMNIGVTIGLLPTKGINLPFISYGGSSLVMTLVSVGILLNISRHFHGDI